MAISFLGQIQNSSLNARQPISLTPPKLLINTRVAASDTTSVSFMVARVAPTKIQRTAAGRFRLGRARLLRSAGVFAACLIGAWIPSMAEELATEANTLRRRATGSRRYGLAAESLALMLEDKGWLRRGASTAPCYAATGVRLYTRAIRVAAFRSPRFRASRTSSSL